MAPNLDELRPVGEELIRLARSLVARRPPTWVLALGAVLGIGLAAGAAGFAFLTPDCSGLSCPAIADLDDYRPPEPPHVYARDGSLAGHLPGPRRVGVPLEQIPGMVQDAFVAVEDRRFSEHDGVDFRGVLRALVENVEAGARVEGASTITMQLARNIFADEVLQYSPWHRKATEVRLAWALESRLSKSEILELYLNQIYLGDGVYGVGTAALHYFDKPVSELTVPEAALLVGMTKNPEGYDPRGRPEQARARRRVVLDVMAREGVISRDRARAAAAEPLGVADGSLVWNRGSHYAAAVDRELRAILPEFRRRAGVRVHTGLDPALQAAAERELDEQIRRIERGELGPFRHPVSEAAATTLPEERVSPHLQGMVVAMDGSTGEVRALVGGRDFARSEFDRAFLARRQPGSAFKPVVLSSVLSDSIPLTDLVRVDSLSLRLEAGEEEESFWRLADYIAAGEGDAEDDPGALTVREALVRSSNVGTVRMGLRVGVGKVAERTHELGIETPVPPYPSIFLGSAEVVPAELVAAYAAFENGGFRVEPHLIRRVESRDGKLLWQSPTPPAPALDPRVAFLVRSVLEDVVDRGTGWRVRAAGMRGPAAGKTGTTNGGKDVWFVGMRPGLVTGVWLGFDRPKSIVPGATGGRLAAPVWGRIMATVPDSTLTTEGWRQRWAPPEGLVRAKVDGRTGYLANESCPRENVRVEHFLAGTRPVDVCPIHGRDLLDRIVSGIRGLFGGDDEPEAEPLQRMNGEIIARERPDSIFERAPDP